MLLYFYTFQSVQVKRSLSLKTTGGGGYKATRKEPFSPLLFPVLSSVSEIKLSLRVPNIRENINSESLQLGDVEKTDITFNKKKRL